MSLICEKCGKRPGITVAEGKKWTEVVLVQYNDNMICQICIRGIEKRDKKRGNSQQTSLF
jgi:hypothetical protein